MASSGDTMVSGAEKDREHWRFVSVQTRGCLSVTRRSDKQREQQLQLAGYLATRECEVVGMGDTRLGGDASDMARMTRTALNGLYNNDTNIHNNNTSGEQGIDTRPTAGQAAERPRLRVGLTYDAAGSHKTANDVWRGGVVLGSLGEANKRMEGRIDDCRGWGRYIGRVYRGASKKTMVVIETYFPDAAYEADNTSREDYSQTLGARAAAALPGVSAARWKHGAAPPKPTLVQTKRPKRLLIDDLTMHLRPYACGVNCTIVIMGDFNTDLISRTGYDNRALQTMIDDLGLASCADARWPASSCVFKTHKGDEAHAASHIDYILISEHNASAVRQFGIDADRDLMVDFDHAVLFTDIDMCQVLGLERSSPRPQVPVRRKSTIRYSDKQGVAQFREFADKLYAKRRVHERVNELIGGLALDEELAAAGLREVNDEERRGWSAVHWRAAGWPDIGLRGRINEACRILDEAASEADAQYVCTFGDSTRTRDKSNSKRVGEGFCPRTKLAAVHCTRLRLLIKLVWRSEWAAAARLRDELVGDGVKVATIAEDDDLRELSVKGLRESLRVARLEVHGRRRVTNLLKSTAATARAQENKLRAAAKRDINAVMERSPRGAIESVTVGSGDGASILTDPVDVAKECCEFSARRMSGMQPKWFRKYDAMQGHTVWVASGNRTRRGLVKNIDNDGHYTLQYDGDEHETCGVRRDAMCLEWQLERSAASLNRRWKRRRGPTGEVERPDMARHVESMAAPPDLPDDTALLFRRSSEGRACRMRAVLGRLTGDDRTQVPSCFAPLLGYLERPVSRTTGATVRESDYTAMVDDDGVPRVIDIATVRRKLSSIAKQKAPGLSGNGPDLYAAQPDSWVEWAVALFNVIQHTQITPHGWHIDLVHYVHKGGSDGSLSNHRPLALIEVLRKVFTGIVVDRMRRDWSRLKVLDECNPGFQAGRTTANAILPVRTAAEYCVATRTEMAVLLDDLKWCFDTPANAVIELALMRLGVPAFYVTMLNDIDMHSVKSTVTAAGLTVDLAGHLGCQGVHRQLHGTGQGTVEGPLNWLPVADIAIAVARAASSQPVTMPTGGGPPVEVPVAVYVDDSSLAQSGSEAVPSLRKMVNMTGFMYYFLGLERRAKKCLWIRLVWCLGVLTRMRERAAEALECDTWITDWATGSPVVSPAKPVRVKEYDHDDEFRHLGYTASLTGRSRTAERSLTSLTRRAARVFATKPKLRDCGVSIVASVLVPKTVYHFAFGKATVAAVEETERGYGDIIRQSLGVAKGFPWNVLSGSLEYDGLGALQLATEVTKARLRQFQSMITSSAAADCSVAMAMVSLAQRWCGSSTPVNMLSANELHLLEPLDATAPQAAHMFHELRRLGYKVAVGWVVRPLAAGDETIYGAYMREAGITGRTEEEIARLQRWRRETRRDVGVRAVQG